MTSVNVNHLLHHNQTGKTSAKHVVALLSARSRVIHNSLGRSGGGPDGLEEEEVMQMKQDYQDS